MNKTRLIIKREYLTRVKKKSFIFLTIFAPFLFAGFFALILFFSLPKDKDYEVLVVDETEHMYAYMRIVQDAEKEEKERDIKYSIDKVEEKKKGAVNLNLASSSKKLALKEFKKEDSKYDYVVYLPTSIVSTSTAKANLYYKEAPNSKTETKINNLINEARERILMDEEKVDLKAYRRIKTKVKLATVGASNLNEQGDEIKEKAGFKIAAYVGFGFSVLILMFITTFGMQVMRGVIEEKTSRIIEIIISSIKPFQIMIGKIIGVGLVGLTQFLFWILLTVILVIVFIPMLGIDVSPDAVSQMGSAEMIEASKSELNTSITAIWNLPWMALISSFLVYFIGGYLLYSSLYAAIGAAVDNETDTQQFMFPVLLPLMLGFYITYMSVLTNPEGASMFWLSMIPFTSPIAMLVRISMESVELWEVLLSIGILILTFIGTTWLGAKIYRTGILMYGKKVTYKEMFKWLRY